MAKQDLTEMTRGNEIDLGWVQDEETGNWTPSVWDRRRTSVTMATMLAEANELPGVDQSLMLNALMHNATDPKDMDDLVDNFNSWTNKA